MFFVEPAALNYLDHLGVDIYITRAELIPKKEIRAAPEIGHFSSGLLHNERSGSHVPRVKVVFKKALKPSTGNIGKVDGRASKPADPMRFIEKFLDDVKVHFSFVKMIIWKTRSEKAFAKGVHRRYPDFFIVAKRRPVFNGVITFLLADVIDDT
jgi:hypothetical protein